MNSCLKYFSACLLALLTQAAFATGPGPFPPPPPPPPPGSASDFTVLAGTAVTCTTSTVNGDVGVSPGTAITQTGCTINGTTHSNDPAAIQANSNFFSAYDQYADIPCTGSLATAYTGATLTLTPGVYCNVAGVTFTTTTLTLDGQGDANAFWIFKIGTGGTGALTGTDFSVVMAGGGQACNVTWWIAEAATMTTSGFQGTILAGAAITATGLAGTTTPFNGDALAKAAVSLTDVTVTGCKGVAGAGPRACSDRVTGGGYIIAKGKKANFGVTGGISKKGKLRGHLTYIDHGTGLKVKGTGVTAYEVVDPKTRLIKGTAKVNGKSGFTYTVVVSDNGEPGKNKDKFAIRLFDASGKLVYDASGTLAGGNIQLHKRRCDQNGNDNDDDDDDDDDGDDDGDH